jgi:hypothetical protein
MSFHAARSPSKAKQFSNCPGTLAICNLLPPEQRNQSGDAARLGTATHCLIEEALGNAKEPADYEGRIILLDEEDYASVLKPNAKTPARDKKFYIVDAEMIESATVMTDYVRGRCEEFGIDPSKIVPAGKTGEGLQLETRTNPLPERDDTSGTADVTIDAWPDMLEVVDYKNGFLLVEHEDNDQTMCYLLGKAIERKFAHSAYRATIVQPRCQGVDPIRPFEVTKKQLLDFQKEYRRKIGTCEKAEAEFESVADKGVDSNGFKRWAKEWLKSGGHCTFCDAQAICPARIKAAEDQAQLDFADEPREIEILPPTKPKKTGELPQDIAQVSQILKWAPFLEALIAAANLYAQRAMEAGYEVPGQKLVRKRSVRKLNPDIAEPDLVAALVKGKFVPDKAKLYTKPKLLSGPQIEKIVPKAKRKSFNEKFLIKPDGGLTIAPESDPREAVVLDVGADFGAIEDHTDEEDFG